MHPFLIDLYSALVLVSTRTNPHPHKHTHTPAPAVRTINLLPGPVHSGLTQVREGESGVRGYRTGPHLDWSLVNISPWPAGEGASEGPPHTDYERSALITEN